MRGVVITSRPIMTYAAPYILLQDDSRCLQRLILRKGEPVTITVNKDTRYCSGWYDIQSHENHLCPDGRTVDPTFEACFACRNKTGFNPAFYNADVISSVQQAYNQQPHSVYIAYFGSGLAKAGIMSDSRGLERIYEQGALLYVHMGSFAHAQQARNLEATLIGKGLRNSVHKKQKEDVLRARFSLDIEQDHFVTILMKLGIDPVYEVKSNLDHFFFDHYPFDQITPVTGERISGKVAGLVGRHLIVENSGRLFGFWLSDLPGYTINVVPWLEDMDKEPMQASMF